jgi:predicted NAD/FAD-binding protein
VRVAVIGSGIAGLGAAHALRRVHDVEVFERDDRAGGHANTVEVARADGSLLALDTGFLVHNRRNYPLLTRLFTELGVRTQDSDMSFGVSCARCRLEYSAVRLWTQPRTVVRPVMARLLAEVVRFLLTGRRALEERHARSTLDDYVRIEGYSRFFRDHFVVPFAAALWSTSPDETLGFPAAYAVRFFENHGLLGFRRHRWRTVTGGSRRYVERITAPLGDRLRLGAGVRAILRDADGVTVRTEDDAAHRFDAVVVATHAPQALAMLGDADDLERGVLGAFRTTRNSTVLHTDARLLPRAPASRASWNYLVDDCQAPSAEPTVTYSLNTLQALDEPEQYCVTLNRDGRIAEDRVLRRFTYAHPLYTFDSLDAQARLPRLDGRRRTWFAGAYHGFGFPEDGLRSGLGAAAGLGATW